MSKPLIPRLLLILALLLTQLGGMTHSIAHAMADQRQDQSLPHHKHCDLCAAYAQVGSALASSDLHFACAAPPEATLAAPSVPFRSLPFAAFAARAPPRSA